MLSKNFNIHIKIINCWLFFILLLVIVSNLPHDNIPTLSWLNSSIYFLIFLQCIFIFRRDQHNKSLFFNLGLFSVFYSFSFIQQYIGNNFSFGNNYHIYYFFEYRKIIISFLLAFCVLYICIKYLFVNLKPLYLYGITLAIIIPIFVWHYYPYLIDKNYIFDIENLSVFYKSILYLTFLPLFFIIFYGMILYLYDRSLGEHINTIMVCFFIMTLMDITDLYGYIYKIKLFSLSQYVLLLVLSFFLITLFRRLNYVYSEFGQFYDSLVVSGNNLGVPIKRKKASTISLLDFAKAYFRQRRNTAGFLTFFFIFCINYFNVSPFLKLNLAVLCFGILVLFFYLTALYQKRSQNGELLTVKRKSI